MIKNMRPFLWIAAIALALVAVFVGTSNASLVTVDEWGNGTYEGQALPSAIIPDPTGRLPEVLAYTLPFQPLVVLDNGKPLDLHVYEPSSQVLSDLITFTGNQLLFYSDNDVADAPGDLGLPNPDQIVGGLFVSEIGGEGDNYALYNPLGFRHGSNGSGYYDDVTYRFNSDVVPEPTTWVLAIMGASCLLAYAWRRRRS